MLPLTNGNNQPTAQRTGKGYYSQTPRQCDLSGVNDGHPPYPGHGTPLIEAFWPSGTLHQAHLRPPSKAHDAVSYAPLWANLQSPSNRGMDGVGGYPTPEC